MTILSVFLITLAGCEKVINIDLKPEPPRLVVDASINWEKGTPGSSQTIRLSTSTGYNQQEIPPVSGAAVTVVNSTNTEFNFVETSNTGRYTCTDFVPKLNEVYKLIILYKGETYIAEERMVFTPELTEIEQTNDLGINNDEIGLKVSFKDTANQRNFYLFRSDFSETPFPEYQILDDRFSDGNKMSWLFAHEKLSGGQTLYFTQFGVSENYYDYMRILINAASGGNNGPFQVVPTKVRGNIVNQSNPANYALGYFRLCETTRINYTVQ